MSAPKEKNNPSNTQEVKEKEASALSSISEITPVFRHSSQHWITPSHQSYAPSSITLLDNTVTKKKPSWHECQAPPMGCQSIREGHELVREEVYKCHRVSTNCFTARSACYLFSLRYFFMAQSSPCCLNLLPIWVWRELIMILGLSTGVPRCPQESPT
ncbi:hypothetical protein BGZ63DRAFT_258123 [Mariannaea sp. PMI_226]|nr:hypothetical protein BGZ63DRAFT_258123 [Mariannaea sp. PMI_226]